MRTVGTTRVGEIGRKSRGTNHEMSGSYPGPANFGLTLSEMESPCDSEEETLFQSFLSPTAPSRGTLECTWDWQTQALESV
ncbi:hypothetical protein LEMLEM_LOCUS22783, partial [Lemmus lemmus]